MKEADKLHDRSAEVGPERKTGRAVDRARARQLGRGREANTPEQIPLRGWWDIFWRVLWSISEDRVLSTSGSVAFFALLAVFPGIAAAVSLYGLFADSSTIGHHLYLLSGFLPGGVSQLIAEQITLVSRQGNETLGTAFAVGLLIALGSANSGMAALFDALNLVYGEREKRSLVRAVNTLLAAINLLSSSNVLWFQWPLLGWGVGVLGHAFLVLRTEMLARPSSPQPAIQEQKPL